MSLRQSAGALLAALLLSACAGGVIPPGTNRPTPTRPIQASEAAARPVPSTPRPPLLVTPPTARPVDVGTAVGVGLTPVPDIASLIPAGERSGKALLAFRASCSALMKRVDQSGLTRGSDWNSACAAASSWPEASASEFFSRYFEAMQIGDGAAFVTGYYEPEIAGSRTRQPGYEVPIYRRPPQLIDVDLGLFGDTLKGKVIRGKVQGRSFVPFEDRAQILSGALVGQGLELAWAADPIEFFFLQVQGSGRLTLPDGSVMRIGYDGQNGRDYVGIGKLMKDRGLIQGGSMQDIIAYLRAHPAEGAEIMNENKSFVFFRELNGPGPVGAMGAPVTPEATVAADPKYVPLGAPVLLSLDRAEPNGLWIAQDTGGAIKGANRFDSFWGAGARARGIAGGMAARGSALILLPIGSAARLGQQ
ncbi:murein transglycosylase A [Sphingobium mellinum]|uniref:murein transglycosylase A n=1 Tax=Sphingobium mellinum TaxID=1387166 RepID=UPI0030EF09FC